MNLRLAPEASLEATQAFEWHEDRRSGLGFEFLDAFRAGLARILADPESFPLYEGSDPALRIRRLRLKRFPYVVIFEVRRDAEEIHVFAVAHTSRRSSYWSDRL